jgi:S-layer family protein
MRSKVLLVAACLLLRAGAAHAQAFTEGFDNITTLPAAGWVQINHSQPIGTTSWFQGNAAVFPAQTGPTNAYIGANFNNGAGTATISNWLLTPPAILVNGATINFWTRKIASTFPDRMQVRMSTAGAGQDVGTTATDVGTFTTMLLDINPTYAPDPAYPIVWTQFNVVVTGVASPTLGRLAFRYFVENGGPAGANSDYIGIDTVVFTPGAAQADFGLTCNPAALTIAPGGNAPSTCTVQSLNAFAAAVNLSCTGLPAGITCAFNPASVTPPANGTVPSTLTVSVGAAVTPGTYNFQAQGVSGALTHTFAMSVTVTAAAVVAPQALAVDAAGNGVLQPNEAAVVVAPSWRNTSSVAIPALTGALTAFTGPAGPTYTINDNAADYGPVAAGATASCGTNCYAVTATAATRPAVHWDATALETVSTGPATKTWTLHVGNTFTDVPPSNGFYRFVETIVHKNVTGGCTATTYCPTGSTTREQMAVFVLVSKEPAGYVPVPCGATPMFTDVPVTSGFCRWIEELARRGVVSGCGTNLYCPTAPATREQMSIFVLRTLDPTLNPPACTTPVFADVPASSPFCRWIEELVRRGVVTGCGGGNYCPTAAVTREQMGVFLTVSFGLTLYGL